MPNRSITVLLWAGTVLSFTLFLVALYILMEALAVGGMSAHPIVVKLAMFALAGLLPILCIFGPMKGWNLYGKGRTTAALAWTLAPITYFVAGMAFVAITIGF